MKIKFIDIICRLLCWSDIPWLIREFYARKKVTMINYHNPKPDVFEMHAQFYVKHYNFVSIDQVIDALENGTLSQLPEKALLVSFDDGYARNADLFPILKRYRIPAVIYVVAGLVNTNRRFWFDNLSHHSEDMKVLKSLPDNERRIKLKHDYDHWDEKEYKEIQALNYEQIQEFISIGGTIGSHTVSHPLLDHCQEDVGYRECKESRELLERLIGSPVEHFALPNGNWNADVISWIQKTGYRSCRITHVGWVNSKTSPFFLPCFGIADTGDIYRIVLQVCGLWYFFKRFKMNK